ncbi:MAG: hypothetical protein JWM85_2311 [Acidimicrobiaceae bacterium]|nr:hypothetical protein [Acidimicrobiaceae bacterium]
MCFRDFQRPRAVLFTWLAFSPHMSGQPVAAGELAQAGEAGAESGTPRDFWRSRIRV